MAVLFAVYIVVQLLSLLYLRSGYGLLKGDLRNFQNTVWRSYSILRRYHHRSHFWNRDHGRRVPFLPPLDRRVRSFVVVDRILGTMLTFIGPVLRLTMGSFRLKSNFGRSTFGHAGILFILGFIFPLFNIIGAILLYRRISSLSLKGETIEFASWEINPVSTITLL